MILTVRNLLELLHTTYSYQYSSISNLQLRILDNEVYQEHNRRYEAHRESSRTFESKKQRESYKGPRRDWKDPAVAWSVIIKYDGKVKDFIEQNNEYLDARVINFMPMQPSDYESDWGIDVFI